MNPGVPPRRPRFMRASFESGDTTQRQGLTAPVTHTTVIDISVVDLPRGCWSSVLTEHVDCRPTATAHAEAIRVEQAIAQPLQEGPSWVHRA